MESEARQEGLGERFAVLWHRKASSDLKSLDPPLAENIIQSAHRKLQSVPHLMGEPLKGTTSRLWKLRFGKYRILYTICKREVIVLAVGNRDFIYNKKNASVMELIRTAAALHEQLKSERPKFS
ncbi:MAG: type II toxin-antitoxin system RelE/ParE family toxin [Candidatus Omnitrophica bacterium]|nr:type II toxin-antitoxin system RelE/ParE family toxin [Candidatus Omnitrophota bacterium]